MYTKEYKARIKCIRQAYKDNCWNLKTLQAATELGYKTVLEVINGRRKGNPSTLLSMEKALGIDRKPRNKS